MPKDLAINEKTLRDISQSIAAHIEPRIYTQITEEPTVQFSEVAHLFAILQVLIQQAVK